MVNKFITWLKRQVGSIYVWGAQGEIAFNEDWIKKMETSDKNAQRAITFYNKQLKLGKGNIAAYDCSGLVVRFLYDNDIIQSDMTANSLYSIGEKIKRANLRAGDLVFRQNETRVHHVGVYIGNDMVIHAKGRDVGVVMEHIDVNGEEYWNRFARINELSGKSETKLPCIMKYCGDTYANLRSSPSALSNETIIDKVSHDEEVLVLALNATGWADVVKICGDKSYKRGYCICKYLKAA